MFSSYLAKLQPSPRKENLGSKMIVAAALEERRKQLEKQVAQEIPAEPPSIYFYFIDVFIVK